MPPGKHLGVRGYRAEVDGLRAVAVLAVVVFHAGVRGLPGGFLGVDVFFVISGYLISRILLEELDRDGFSLLSFYERRARRILPALFVVIVFTFPLAYLLAPPEAFADYLGSVNATALFLSNVFFWKNIGYFKPASEEQPLLHTWSLGVEEQFYIVFPLLLWLAWRFARAYLLPVFTCLFVIGFAVCLYQQARGHETAFFLLHARAWELLAGVIVTLLERRTHVMAWRDAGSGQVFAAAGLICVAVGFSVVTLANNVPGWPTLYPVTGTVLVLLFAGEGGHVGRLLGARPVVAFGLISYGFYLWHHPLFAFARLYSINRPPTVVMLALAVLAVALATVTYYVVEKPFRDRKRISGRVVFVLSGAAIFSAVMLAGTALQDNWPEARFPPSLLASISPPLYRTENCNWRLPDSDVPDIMFCHVGAVDAPHPVIIWGDSHAQALVGELDRALLLKGWSGIYVNATKCFQLPGIYNAGRENDKVAATCAEQQDHAFKMISALQPKAFVINLRWTMRMFPLPGTGDTVGFDNGEGGVEVEDSRELVALADDGRWSVGLAEKAKAVTLFFGRLTQIAPVIAVGPVPEVGWHVGNRNFKTLVLRHEGAADINTSSALFRARNSSALSVLETASKQPAVTLIQPSTLFCNTLLPGRCVAQQAGVAYYSDDDHLSQTGARMLVGQIVSALPQP